MLVKIEDIIWNLAKFECVCVVDKDNTYPPRISFFRGSEEVEYQAFNTIEIAKEWFNKIELIK